MTCAWDGEATEVALGSIGDPGARNTTLERTEENGATFDGWDTYLGASPLLTPENFDFAVSAGVGGAWSYGSHPDGPRMRADGSLAGHFRYAGSITTSAPTRA